MTNKERQASLDQKKWLASERIGADCSGLMDYCSYCERRKNFTCKVSQEERESKCVCATAYNRMTRAK